MAELNMEEIELKDGEQLDILKTSGFKILQNKEKFMFGIDAYLLADFIEPRNNEIAVDFGTGTGIIPLLLAKSRFFHIDALEIQSESFEMAQRSVKINNLEGKISVVQGDIKKACEIFGGNYCNVVFSNPPYMTTDSGKLNPSDFKNIARHEILCSLEDVIHSASQILKSNGRFYMIHRPNRLPEIFVLLNKYKMVPRCLRLIYPFADRDATMILIEARKTGSPDLKVMEPLVVYEKPGVYTETVRKIYEKL